MNIENETLLTSYFINNFNKAEQIPTQYFQDESLQDILKGLEQMRNQHLDFSVDTLSVELSKLNSKVKINQLMDIKDAYSEFNNIEYHLSLLKSDYQKNVIGKGLIASLTSKVNSAGVIRSDELENDLDNIKKIITSEDEIQFLTSEDLVDRHTLTMIRRMNPDRSRSTGFKCVDEKVTRPGAAGEIHLYASLRGVGKSTHRQAEENNLINKGIPVVTFSIEMSEESTMDRQIAMKTGIPMLEMNKKPEEIMNDFKYRRMTEEFKKYKNYLFTDDPDLSFKKIDKALYKARDIFRSRGVFKDKEEYMVITIDVLNMVSDFGDQDPQSILKAMDNLHRMVKKHRVHCKAIVQINETKLRNGKQYKEPDELKNYRPNLEDIYGGSAYGQRARVVTILHRPKFLKERFFPEMAHIWEAEEDILQYHCVKQNDGELFLQEFIFDGERMRIYPRIAPSEE